MARCIYKRLFCIMCECSQANHASEYWIHWRKMPEEDKDLLQGLTLQALNAHVQRAIVLGLESSHATQE